MNDQSAKLSPATRQESGHEKVCVLETTLGRLAFRLLEQGAPLTCARITALVEEGFYDGASFYRVVRGHVAQAGCGAETDAPTVRCEPGAHPHVAGAVGLARHEDPDSGCTEIYFCLAPRPQLDGRFAVFGQLVEGHDVLHQIGEAEVEEQYLGASRIPYHRPVEPIVIRRAWLERRGTSS